MQENNSSMSLRYHGLAAEIFPGFVNSHVFSSRFTQMRPFGPVPDNAQFPCQFIAKNWFPPFRFTGKIIHCSLQFLVGFL